MSFARSARPCSVVLLVLLCAACGGGGGGGGGTAPAAGTATNFLGVSTQTNAVFSPGMVVEIDHSTGATKNIGARGLRGLSFVHALAVDASGTLYVASAHDGMLARLDPATGEYDLVGPAAKNIEGLTFDELGRLLGISLEGDLYLIDTQTAATTLIGNAAVPGENFSGLAWDNDADVLYAVGAEFDRLYAIDLFTGIATGIGAGLGVDNVEGLEYSPFSPDEGLYGSATSAEFIVKIDTSTGVATLQDAIPANSGSALALDLGSQLAYLVGDFRKHLYVLDTNAGGSDWLLSCVLAGVPDAATFDSLTGTLVTSMFHTGLCEVDTTSGLTIPQVLPFVVEYAGLAHDPVDDVLYGSVPNGTIAVVDPLTGLPTLFADLSGFGTLGDLAFEPITRELFVYITSTSHLVSISVQSQVPTDWGALLPASDPGIASIDGLAFDPSAFPKLYASGRHLTSDDEPRLLEIDITINPPHVQIVPGSGRFGSKNPDIGLCYDEANDQLFVLARAVDSSLYRVDKDDGRAQSIGSLGWDRIEGLAYDSNTDTVYALDVGTGVRPRALSIDPTTGEGTFLGELTQGIAGGFTFDTSRNVIWTLNWDLGGRLVSLDPANGVETVLNGPGTGTPLLHPRGLAHDAGADRIYCVASNSLFSADPTIGIWSLVGALGLAAEFGEVESLTFDVPTGKLFATTDARQSTFETNVLVEIDPTSAAATIVGVTRWPVHGLCRLP